MNNNVKLLTIAGGLVGLLFAVLKVNDDRRNEKQGRAAVFDAVSGRIDGMDLEKMVGDAVGTLVSKSYKTEVDTAVRNAVNTVRSSIQNEVASGVEKAFPDVRKEVAERMLSHARGYSQDQIDQKIVSKAREIAANKFRDDVKDIRDELKEKYDDRLEEIVDDLEDRYEEKMKSAVDNLKSAWTFFKF